MTPFAKRTPYFLVGSIILIFSCKKENLNHPPIAAAGTDQVITLPNNTILLDGSGSTDPDNNINRYLWDKISGPSSFIMSNTTKKTQTLITNLVEGNYQFELTVIDDQGLLSKDTLQITVNAAPLPAPSSVSVTYYFSDLKWSESPADNGVKLLVPQIQGRNANDVKRVATVDQSECNGPWGICYWSDFSSIPKDGSQPGIIYYRVETNSVVLYIKSQPYNSTYQNRRQVVLVDF